MKLIYGLGGLALAQAVAFGVASSSEEKSVARREAQEESLLCTTSSQVTPETIQPFCANKIQTLATSSTWSPCCTFSADPSDSLMCRNFETDGVYCDDSSQDCSVLLTESGHSLTLNLNFTEGEEACCKSCTCFGDPECVSFESIANVWIPCDGRTPDCRIRRGQCESMPDPNGGNCQWIRPGSVTNRGWNMAMRGSPCVPDLTKDILMEMYTTDDGKFSMNLGLGERGVIKKIFIGGDVTATITADDCFDADGAAAWSGISTLPDGWVQNAKSGSAVSWTLFDGNNGVLVKFLCSRAASGGVTGAPRINVEEISVEIDATGSGFCMTGEIAEAGDTSPSVSLHSRCVQDRADPLQACKHLVSMAATMNELQNCALQYCSAADLNAAQQDDCVATLATDKFQDVSFWETYYCQALVNQGGHVGAGNVQSCVSQVRAQGWNHATGKWDKGLKALTASRECGSSISEYSIDQRPTCVDGLTIQTKNDSDEWEDNYFIPFSKPLCNGRLVIEPTPENIILFTRSVRVRQCDVKGADECKAVGSCASTVGADFSLTYSSTAGSIQSLIDQGLLKCSVPDDEGSWTWCLDGLVDGYSPDEDVCPCPTDERRARRALLGL